MQPERLVTLKEAAALAGLSYSHVALLARTGKLQAWRFGRTWLTTPEAVAAYLRDPEKRSHDPLKNRRRTNSNR